jgi:hypothetical protein
MEIKSAELAQSQFEDLIKKVHYKALWFLKESSVIKITEPIAITILNSIGAHCSRDEWIIVRSLKEWRLQNIK